jgi:hypothetical protein
VVLPSPLPEISKVDLFREDAEEGMQNNIANDSTKNNRFTMVDLRPIVMILLHQEIGYRNIMKIYFDNQEDFSTIPKLLSERSDRNSGSVIISIY